MRITDHIEIIKIDWWCGEEYVNLVNWQILFCITTGHGTSQVESMGAKLLSFSRPDRLQKNEAASVFCAGKPGSTRTKNFPGWFTLLRRQCRLHVFTCIRNKHAKGLEVLLSPHSNPRADNSSSVDKAQPESEMRLLIDGMLRHLKPKQRRNEECLFPKCTMTRETLRGK